MSLVAVIAVCVGVVYEPLRYFYKKNFWGGVICSNTICNIAQHEKEEREISGRVIIREGLERKQCFS